jgi:hypothetical protein
VSILNAYYDTETLDLMSAALAAASRDRHFPDDIAGRALRTAMAFQIMTAVRAGERDPERLRLAALNVTAGQALKC